MTPARDSVTLPRVISVDDHVMEPPNLWWDRLPRAVRDLGPHVRRERGRMVDHLLGPWQVDADGDWADVWYFGDMVKPLQRGMVQSGHWDEDTARPLVYDEVHPGAYQREARLQVLDENHTDASICFPNITRFCGQMFLEHPDKDVALLGVQAYNDWMIDEWCGHERPARLVPLTLVPLWDPELAVAEVHRCAEKGAHAITFPELPASLRLPSIYTDHWDRLFAACEATDTVINMHVGSSSSRVTTSPDAPIDMVVPLLFVNSQLAFSDWLYSGILQEFTNLRIVLSEGQVGWMPFTAQRMDSAWHKIQGQDEFAGRRATELPSSVIPGRIFGCVYDDLQGLVDRDAVGVEQIMVETDFPHTDSTYPHSAKVLGDLMTEAGLDDHEIDLVTRANAVRVYGLDRYFGITS